MVHQLNNVSRISAASSSSSQGVVLNGLLNLHSITGDPAFLDSCVSIVVGVMSLLAVSQDGLTVLFEAGGIRDSDAQLFKGIFVRNLRNSNLKID